ncbi:MAG TPA: hypothetical protein VM755_20570 [Stellaceae bacterium]|nr:hypothetical protein [Stellaceae bacterium]
MTFGLVPRSARKDAQGPEFAAIDDAVESFAAVVEKPGRMRLPAAAEPFSR